MLLLLLLLLLLLSRFSRVRLCATPETAKEPNAQSKNLLPGQSIISDKLNVPRFSIWAIIKRGQVWHSADMGAHTT